MARSNYQFRNDDFSALIDSTKSKNENAVQKFIEGNAGFMPLPHLQNHQVHMNSVIAKLEIYDRVSADIVYLTKSSVDWWIVLIELEAPQSSVLTERGGKYQPSSDLNHALGQIRDWRTALNDPTVRAAFLKKINPLLRPLSENTVHFRYAVVIGRDTGIPSTEAAAMRCLSDIKENDRVTVWTYDSILRNQRSWWPSAYNVLHRVQGKFRFKNILTLSTSIFSCVSPSDLLVTTEQLDQLKARGFDMDAWQSGKLLLVNNKRTSI